MIKALLLEDNANCREILVQALSGLEIKVEAHEDPTCFLKKADRCPVDTLCVDFILTDNQMPHMNGLDFLQTLDEMKCKIPTQNRAIISGNLSNDDLEKIDRLGIKTFYKPCSLIQIFDWLKEIGVLPR